MQITDHIHALKIPFQITNPSGQRIARFVYAFLIYGKKICLIDSGVAGSEMIILEYLKRTGRSQHEISMLILTHAHPDHIGSADAIKRISGCTVAAHAAEKAWIEDVDLQAKERPVPGFFTLVGGSVQVDRILKEGDVLHLEGGPALRVMHTPGHSPGSLSLWLAEEGALFTADAVPIAGDMPIYQDILASVRSVQRLASIPQIKLLLAAWDEPHPGNEAYRIMDDGLQYLQRIHSSVLKVAGENPALREQDSMQLCRRVLVELGLPPVMANPLVASSFQDSLRKEVQNQQNLLIYEDEDKIVWLKDRDALARMNYVREKWLLCPIRTGPVKAAPGEMLIGYAVLKKTTAKTDEKGFCRRIFTLRPEDRFCDPKGDFQDSMPPEAVDPLLVEAGKPSRRII
jgi:glyoxylase-like metal-dependent hydrolase (beta-lactamase superfamily II)